ncbi:uncharacterized protein BCR38DRAFT_453421 [Pseudomassariella vexata]|uniref:Uncharacterized protein n=1 Tax=Pseudomassariella vexata TaxID=1141098 RepID=A0A1Y2D5H4_9PEZI|nr:uncharacterized protein BCR38DRAFT_453421 [Pseudomassariella vexata]ORY54548.1 hypothetical protein BCR38DRAFT_453421 [Pseudomassariella vexata]
MNAVSNPQVSCSALFDSALPSISSPTCHDRLSNCLTVVTNSFTGRCSHKRTNR